MDRDITPLEGLLIMYLSMIGTLYAISLGIGVAVVLVDGLLWIWLR
jgi:hypothetical protein